VTAFDIDQKVPLNLPPVLNKKLYIQTLILKIRKSKITMSERSSESNGSGVSFDAAEDAIRAQNSLTSETKRAIHGFCLSNRKLDQMNLPIAHERKTLNEQKNASTKNIRAIIDASVAVNTSVRVLIGDGQFAYCHYVEKARQKPLSGKILDEALEHVLAHAFGEEMKASRAKLAKTNSGAKRKRGGTTTVSEQDVLIETTLSFVRTHRACKKIVLDVSPKPLPARSSSSDIPAARQTDALDDVALQSHVKTLFATKDKLRALTARHKTRLGHLKAKVEQHRPQVEAFMKDNHIQKKCITFKIDDGLEQNGYLVTKCSKAKLKVTVALLHKLLRNAWDEVTVLDGEQQMEPDAAVELLPAVLAHVRETMTALEQEGQSTESTRWHRGRIRQTAN